MPIIHFKSLSTGVDLIGVPQTSFGTTLGPAAAPKYVWALPTAGAAAPVQHRFRFYNLGDRIERHRYRQVSAACTAWYTPIGGGGVARASVTAFSISEDRLFTGTPIDSAVPASQWPADAGPGTPLSDRLALPPVTLSAFTAMELQAFVSWTALYDDEVAPDDNEPPEGPPAGLSISGTSVHVDGPADLLAAYQTGVLHLPDDEPASTRPGRIWIADPAFRDLVRRHAGDAVLAEAARDAVVVPEMLSRSELRSLASDLKGRLRRGEAALKSLERALANAKAAKAK